MDCFSCYLAKSQEFSFVYTVNVIYLRANEATLIVHNCTLIRNSIKSDNT